MSSKDIKQASDILQAIKQDRESGTLSMSNDAVDQAIQEAIAYALLDIAKSLDFMVTEG